MLRALRCLALGVLASAACAGPQSPGEHPRPGGAAAPPLVPAADAPPVLAAALATALAAARRSPPDASRPALLTPPGAEVVRVVSFAPQGRYHAGDRLERHDEIWVTLDPALQGFCRAQRVDDLDLRVRQRLGLLVARPTDHYEVAVLSARRRALFRPCPDSALEGQCASAPGPDPHRAFFDDQVRARDDAANRHPFPFTGRGYTCDWVAGGCGVGETEFIVARDAPVAVVEVHPLPDYCRP